MTAAKAYPISGMTCEGCTRSLKRAVEKALGPDTATVQRSPGQLTVHGEHDPEVVLVAVERAGFSITPED
jgi:Cu+-exporting ATPase